MGLFGERKKEPWHLGDVDLSKLEGESPQRAARVKAYLNGGEERYQEEREKQHMDLGEYRAKKEQERRWTEYERKKEESKRDIEQRQARREELLRELEQKIAASKMPIILPDDEPEVTEEDLDELHQDAVDLANTIEQMATKMSRALATAIQAIHDIEGDDSFTTDDLQMAVAYLAALQDPQD